MELEDEENEEYVKNISRNELYSYIKECSACSLDAKIEYMQNRVAEITNCPQDKRAELKRILRHFKSQFKTKWSAASNKQSRFFTNNKKWLNGYVKVKTWTQKKAGRPSKKFEDSSDRSKRRKTKELREQVPVETLTYAAQMSLRAAGKSDASAVIQEITKSPTRATKVRHKINKIQQENFEPLTIKKALSIFVEANLTRRQYNIIRNASPKLFPCYSLIQKAKADCYPKKDAYRVTETCAEIKLQDLVDHTASRLCLHLDEVLQTIPENEKENLELIFKWGCDGSQQQQFKLKFESNSESDANIFQSSLVPIRLILKSNDGNEKIIWQNPLPSSPRFCRPIRIRFMKESKDITEDEIKYVENQVLNLRKTEVNVKDSTFKVKHTFLLTMVDGKVCNAATNTLSTMRCYICKKTSKDFNKLEKDREEIPETFKFGLSILHARIRLFESILHLSYKLPIKKWQCRSAAEKQVVKETKSRIQQAFKEEMSLLVDIPKAGFGNTNDGNTARRFFADPNTSARITGVDAELIRRFKIILEVISSGHKISTEKLATFCNDTAEIYVSLYGWHPMTPTVHKILVHGPTIIEHAIVPIGQLSEEAAEARNKHFRQYRQDFARKFSRTACNMDVLNRLLLTSDPMLSCERPKNREHKKPFSKEALEFLLPMEAEVFCPENEKHIDMGFSEENSSISDEGDV